jgi:hypothetical protein
MHEFEYQRNPEQIGSSTEPFIPLASVREIRRSEVSSLQAFGGWSTWYAFGPKSIATVVARKFSYPVK